MNRLACRNHSPTRTHRPIWKRFFVTSALASALVGALAVNDAGMAFAQDKADMKADAGLTSLITDTPEAGFALAVKLSQKGVTTTQTDASIRKALRPAYANDPNSLIAVSHVVATHFQTIAAANDYWRK